MFGHCDRPLGPRVTFGLICPAARWESVASTAMLMLALLATRVLVITNSMCFVVMGTGTSPLAMLSCTPSTKLVICHRYDRPSVVAKHSMDGK